ncbi:VaFE repeat-containing surface-anchored protein [Helcococcus ovis]
METTAVDNETGKKESLPLEEVIIKDKVMYYDLIIGKTYIVDGTLMYKLTNKPVLVNGKEVKASKEFIPTSRNGFLELLFTVPGSVVRGKETVVFEDLYKDGKLITFHRDIHDKAQTTRTTNPRIKTTLMEVGTGAKEFLPLDKLIHLVDRIEYFDLVLGIKMRFDLVLMNSVTKEVLKDANGKELTASLEFTPETKDGVAEVFITVNAKDLRGISPVAFETLSDISVEGKVRKVAEHKDFNDKGQTVDILKKPEKPETGDSGVALFGAMTIISTLGLIFTFITIKNKKGSLD